MITDVQFSVNQRLRRIDYAGDVTVYPQVPTNPQFPYVTLESVNDQITHTDDSAVTEATVRIALWYQWSTGTVNDVLFKENIEEIKKAFRGGLFIPDAEVTEQSLVSVDRTTNVDGGTTEKKATITLRYTIVPDEVQDFELTTDNVQEGDNNLYFSDERARNAVAPDIYESSTRIYVDKEEGEDVPLDYNEADYGTLPGRNSARAFASVGRAIEEINQRIRSTNPIYDDPDPIAISVAAGTYIVDNPIRIPDKVSVTADSLRSVIIKPQNPKADLFHVNRLNYLEGVRIKDTQYPAFSIAFPSANVETEITSGELTEANITYSPVGYEADYEGVFKEKYPVESALADLSDPTKEGQLAAVEDGSSIDIYSSAYNASNNLEWQLFASTSDGSVSNGLIQPLKPDARVTEPRAENGTRAEVDLTIENGKITGATVTNSGSGYSLKPTVSVAAPCFQQPWINGSPYVQNASSITGPFTEKDADGNRKEIPDTMPLPYDTENPGKDPITGETINRPVDELGSGGGMKIDGRVCQGWNKITQNHPAFQNTPRSPLKSMVGAQYTQVNQAGPGHFLLNDGFGQFVSCFTTFSTYSYRCNSGGLALVSNSVSDFGKEGLVAEGKYDIPYTTGTTTESRQSTVANVRVQDGGFDYDPADTIEIDPPASGTAAQLSMTVQNGEIIGVTIENEGSGYTSVPEVTVNTSTGQAASFKVEMDKVGTINVENLDTFVQAGGEEITQRPQVATVLDLQGQDRDITNWNANDDGTYDVTVTPPAFEVTAGTEISFHQNSRINSGGHTYEFVGSGVTYNALPEYGGIADPAQQETETGAGKVFITSSDQRGNFRIGDAFRVNQTTGSVTINTDNFNLSGLNSVGPFEVEGTTVGVQLKEVTNRSDMRSNSGLSGNTVPTVFSIRQWVNNEGIGIPEGGDATQVLKKQSGVDRDADWGYVKYSEVQNAPTTTDDLSEGSSNLYFTNERVDDRVNGLLKAGTHVSKAYDDGGGTLTLDVDDALSAYTNDAGYITDYTVTESDVTQHESALTITESQISDLSHYTDEKAQDAVGTILSNDFIYDDANGSISLDSSVTDSYSDEQAQDAVNALLSAGSNINLAYDDANDDLTISTTAQGVDIEDGTDGTALVSGVTAIQFDGNLTVTDDGDGTVTVDAPATQVLSGGTNITIDGSDNINFDGLGAFSTDDLSEGSSNLYHTDQRALDAVETSSEVVLDGTLALRNTSEGSRFLEIDTKQNTIGSGTTEISFRPKNPDGTDTGGTILKYVDTGNIKQMSIGPDGIDGSSVFKSGVAIVPSAKFHVQGGEGETLRVDREIDLTNGGSINGLTTDGISEGSNNLFYTDERVQDTVNTLLSAGSGVNLNYDDANDSLTIASTGGILTGQGKPDASLGSNGDNYVNTLAESKGLMVDISSLTPEKASMVTAYASGQMALASIDENNDNILFNVAYKDGTTKQRKLNLGGKGLARIEVQNNGSDVGDFTKLNFGENIQAVISPNGALVESHTKLKDGGNLVDGKAKSINFGKGIEVKSDSTVEPTRYTGVGKPKDSYKEDKDFYVDKRAKTEGLINPLVTHGPAKTQDMVNKYSQVKEQVVLGTVDETNDAIIFEVSYSDGTRKNARISLT